LRIVMPGPPGPREAWLSRPYAQLLRGPNLRWWRAPLSLAVVLGGFAVLVLGAAVAGALWSLASPSSGDPSGLTSETSPLGLLATNLVLAALIPISQLAVWVAYRWRPRWVASVAGGVRWRLLVAGYLVAAVVTVGLDLGLGFVLGGSDEGPLTPEKQWPQLLLVVALTTPLQAAGEEYFFRGWVQQVVGSWFARPAVSALAAALVSSTLFALAHGQQDPWLFADRFVFGLIACWLVWRTGGLEAGMALHGVNNLVAFAFTIASGGLAETLDASAATPQEVGVDVLTLGLTALAIVGSLHGRAVRRLFVPPIGVLTP
jgi:membrane protease YdiL (CAAX protease family)